MPSRLLGQVMPLVSFTLVETKRGPGQSFEGMSALGLREAPYLLSLSWVGQLGSCHFVAK